MHTLGGQRESFIHFYNTVHSAIHSSIFDKNMELVLIEIILKFLFPLSFLLSSCNKHIELSYEPDTMLDKLTSDMFFHA